MKFQVKKYDIESLEEEIKILKEEIELLEIEKNKYKDEDDFSILNYSDHL